MTPITFRIYGDAKPAGSKTPCKPIMGKSGKMFTPLRDSSGAKGKAWRQDVAAAATKAMKGREIINGPVRVWATFYRARPRGHFNAKGLVKPSAPLYPLSAPDTTKMFRAVEDSMKGIVWRDDAQVVEQIVYKRFATEAETPGVVVTVEAM